MTSLASILEEHSELKLLPSNRIKCSVTGHELPPNLAAVLSHLNGKKYRKALEWYNQDYSRFLPHIVPHKSDQTKLYCNVTGETLNKITSQVEKHVNGKRFLRLKKEYDIQKEKKSKKEAKMKEYDEEDEEADFWVPAGLEDDDNYGPMHEDNSDFASEDEQEVEEAEEEEIVPKKNSFKKAIHQKKPSISKQEKAKKSNKRKRSDEEDDVVVIRKVGDGKRVKRTLESVAH